MQSRPLTRCLLLSGALLLCVSCVTPSRPLVAFQSACSGLVPESWVTTGVTSASLPTGTALETDETGAWRDFSIRQTGRLDTANERTKDAVGIIQRCEERDKTAVREATRGPLWWANPGNW